jgi:hypothetical protein
MESGNPRALRWRIVFHCLGIVACHMPLDYAVTGKVKYWERNVGLGYAVVTRADKILAKYL